MSDVRKFELVVNGEKCAYMPGEFPENPIVLMKGLGLNPEKVVVEINGAIIRRDDLSGYALADGDKIELVAFVGGG